MIIKICAEIKKMFLYWKTHKTMALASIFPPLLLCLLFVGAFQTTGQANLVIVNQDKNNSITEKFIEVLGSNTGTIPHFNLMFAEKDSADKMLEMHDTFAVLYIPSGFGESIEKGESASMTVKFTAIHEDISKNVRLGIEARIYDFVKLYDLDTGKRPGIVIDEHLEKSPLARSDYMMGGIVIWTMAFLGLLIGGAIGASEKEEKTKTYIQMAADGERISLLGKWISTIIISGIMLVILVIGYVFLFGLKISSVSNVFCILLLFLIITTMFSFPGVLYGNKVGDFRLVPAPMIVLSITLWIVSGALNPLEFSAGYSIFKYFPTSAAIRLISFSLFDRGSQFVNESLVILVAWTIFILIGAVFWFYGKKHQKKLFKS
jgi:ABC-type multidrug transport system permease subunit